MQMGLQQSGGVAAGVKVDSHEYRVVGSRAKRDDKIL